METIRDIAWQAQTLRGTLERFDIESFQAVTVGVSVRKETRGSAYRYRLFLFTPSERVPVYAINLESDIFGEWLLTEQLAKAHRILRRLNGPLVYEEFRINAVEYALVQVKRFQKEKNAPENVKAIRKDRR